MSDTSPSVDELLGEMYRARTPGTRLRMATALFATARRLALAGARAGGVNTDERALRRALVERLYGDQLPVDAQRALADGPARGRTDA